MYVSHTCIITSAFLQILGWLLPDLEYKIVLDSDNSLRLVFPDSVSAKSAVCALHKLKPKNGRQVSAQFGVPDSFLFVGNLPLTFTESDLRQLFLMYGGVVRCFIVCSTVTGQSKGYGFVEFETREEASVAKQRMATKVVGSRGLRVDFTDSGMQVPEDLHSLTLFVDLLPKDPEVEQKLATAFSHYGTVNFCKVRCISP